MKQYFYLWVGLFYIGSQYSGNSALADSFPTPGNSGSIQMTTPKQAQPNDNDGTPFNDGKYHWKGVGQNGAPDVSLYKIDNTTLSCVKKLNGLTSLQYYCSGNAVCAPGGGTCGPPRLEKHIICEASSSITCPDADDCLNSARLSTGGVPKNNDPRTSVQTLSGASISTEIHQTKMKAAGTGNITSFCDVSWDEESNHVSCFASGADCPSASDCKNDKCAQDVTPKSSGTADASKIIAPYPTQGNNPNPTGYIPGSPGNPDNSGTGR
jgi:hypothetical protein